MDKLLPFFAVFFGFMSGMGFERGEVFVGSFFLFFALFEALAALLLILYPKTGGR